MAELRGTRDAYAEALLELGKKDKNIVVLDADLSESTRTERFCREFPDRFFNMGVAEQNMVNTAAGLASCGKIAFASTFAVFATGRVWEQIRNTVSYSKLEVKIVASHGGITVGPDGASHQCTEDIALMRVIPEMTVVVPCDAHQAKKAVMAAAYHKGPFYIRMSRVKFPVITDSEAPFEIGKAEVMKEGEDVTIVAFGIMVSQALAACELLKKEGINATVINMHTIKPLDTATLVEAANATGAVVTAEEHSIIGGLGSAVSEALSELSPLPVRRLGVRDRFGQSGDPQALLKEYGLDTTDIITAVKQVIGQKRSRR